MKIISFLRIYQRHRFFSFLENEIMEQEGNGGKRHENNPETGTNNVFRPNGAKTAPEEAGGQGSATAPTSDKGDLGRKTHMERTSYQDDEGHFTMDDESEEGLWGRLPGDEPGA